MDTPQPLRWKSSFAHRAARISPDVWIKHKQEICDLYQEMTLDELMADMAARHDFNPTRRQYTAQLEKWQCKKYQMSTPPVDKEPQHNSHSSSIIPVNTPEPKKHSANGWAFLRAKKDPAASTAGAIDPREEAKVHAVRPAVLLSQGYTAEEMLQAIENREYVLVEKRRAVQVVNDPDKRNLPPRRLATPPKPTETTDVYLNRLQVEPIDIHGLATESRVQAYQRHWSTGPREIQTLSKVDTMLRVADFLLVIGCREEAFNLYDTCLDIDCRQELGIELVVTPIMGCIRSASSGGQLQWIRELLWRRLVDTERVDMREALEDLVDMTLMKDLQDRSEQDPSETVFRIAARREAALGSHNKSFTSIAFYAQLYQTCDSIQGRARVRDIVGKLFVEAPYSRGRAIINPCLGSENLASCLRWCEKELERSPEIWGLELIHRHDSKRPTIAEVFLLFCSLWRYWQPSRRSPGFPDDPSLWKWSASPLISQADTLYVTCDIMLSQFYRGASPSLKCDNACSLSVRALTGVRMNEFTPSGSEVLDAYIRLYHTKLPIDEVQSAHLRQFAMSCLQQSLPIEDAELAAKLRSALAMAPPNQNMAHPSTTPLWETFAASLNTSSFDSFRLTHERTKARTTMLSSLEKMSWRFQSSTENSMQSLQSSLKSMDLS